MKTIGKGLHSKKALFMLAVVGLLCLSFSAVGLASMLGISSAAALKVIDIIDTVSTIATVISLIAVVVGAGVVSTAIVATAKQMIKKYGKKYAAAW